MYTTNSLNIPLFMRFILLENIVLLLGKFKLERERENLRLLDSDQVAGTTIRWFLQEHFSMECPTPASLCFRLPAHLVPLLLWLQPQQSFFCFLNHQALAIAGTVNFRLPPPGTLRPRIDHLSSGAWRVQAAPSRPLTSRSEASAFPHYFYF